jgi:glycosyltransferase involved in cell wall biosynthesis
MACTKPVISTKVGIAPEILKDGKAGLLVNFNNREELVMAVSRLLENGTLRSKMGNCGHHIVFERFTWEKIVDQLVDIYRSVLDS